MVEERPWVRLGQICAIFDGVGSLRRRPRGGPTGQVRRRSGGAERAAKGPAAANERAVFSTLLEECRRHFSPKAKRGHLIKSLFKMLKLPPGSGFVLECSSTLANPMGQTNAVPKARANGESPENGILLAARLRVARR
mmetsp:Transcript_7272/g.26006  ORF Transcript_7272/g.26006 Transcript_7272/m.26006 type:complete len:138 (+) Transcript_7272:248-661(+)